MKAEVFDLLVIGGGISGAAVARDAVSRGLTVALVEKNDFAYGTSSRSSKLIHGGLRYLENFEFGLVFEALSERTFLLKSAPHLVKPLLFYFPVYEGDKNGRAIMTAGLWLYDLLALFRAPGFHRGLSAKGLLKRVPLLNTQGLRGGFSYYDASMWDDVLAVETLRDASAQGAAVANYIEAVDPIWEGELITGYRVRDREVSPAEREFTVRARRTVVCAGPWTDQVGQSLDKNWARWLTPSKGVHLVFDLKRLPVSGVVVMTNPSDGRVAFVIPRPEYGAGVVIVGTTDGPTPDAPDEATVDVKDVQYLLDLLRRYFPSSKLSSEDVVSAYVGVRPLMGREMKPDAASSSESKSSASVLQQVSREHHIARGPGGVTLVAGGKYTTHRRMAQEIVDFTLSEWKKDSKASLSHFGPSRTSAPVNGGVGRSALKDLQSRARDEGLAVDAPWVDRYGQSALGLARHQRDLNQQLKAAGGASTTDPEGFNGLASMLKYSLESEMVLHLEDFYLRRIPLFLSRADQGLPWVEPLADLWAQELGKSEAEKQAEVAGLKAELAKRSGWRKESGSSLRGVL